MREEHNKKKKFCASPFSLSVYHCKLRERYRSREICVCVGEHV